MDLRSIQKPLKQSYRDDAAKAQITLSASASSKDNPIVCSVEIGRKIQEAFAHEGVGGGGGACSGDLLLGALAACAQITCQLVATAMGIETKEISVTVDGDMDFRGTLGISPDVLVGFSDIRLMFRIDAPNATDEQLASLLAKAEKYCVVLQTLVVPPKLTSTMVRR